jgi:hypothetical protein
MEASEDTEKCSTVLLRVKGTHMFDMIPTTKNTIAKQKLKRIFLSSKVSKRIDLMQFQYCL